MLQLPRLYRNFGGFFTISVFLQILLFLSINFQRSTRCFASGKKPDKLYLSFLSLLSYLLRSFTSIFSFILRQLSPNNGKCCLNFIIRLEKSDWAVSGEAKVIANGSKFLIMRLLCSLSSGTICSFLSFSYLSHFLFLSPSFAFSFFLFSVLLSIWHLLL